MKYFHFVIFLTLSLYGFGQQVSVSNITENNGRISFILQITKSHSERERYDLFIYHSGNNFTEPINETYNNLEPGKSHRISFDGGQEIGNYQGAMSFRFDIEASKFPIRTEFEDQKFKIGKEANIAWYDYGNSGPYDIELYKDGQMVKTLASNLTSSSQQVIIPDDLKKKEEYQIQIRASDRSVDSEKVTITVQPKMGLLVKILPVVAVGAAVPFILPGADGGGGGNEASIANPPGPPQGN